MEVNGSSLFYESGEPIIVDVTSGQVTYYKRQMIDFVQQDIEAVEAGKLEDAFSPVNLIAQNCKYIYEILVQKGEVPPTDNQDAMLNEVAARVKAMQIGYIKPSDKDATEIQPVWEVTIGTTNVYFDLYSADPVGYSQE